MGSAEVARSQVLDAWEKTWRGLRAQHEEAHTALAQAIKEVDWLASFSSVHDGIEAPGFLLPSWGTLLSFRRRVGAGGREQAPRNSEAASSAPAASQELRVQLRQYASELQAETESLYREEQCLQRELRGHLGQLNSQLCEGVDELDHEGHELEEELQAFSLRCEQWLPSAKASPSGRRRPAAAHSAGTLRQDRGAGGSSSSTPASCRSRCTAPACVASFGTGDAHEEDEEVRRLRAALAELEASLRAAGGPSGGWTSLDHAAFLRVSRPMCASQNAPELVVQSLCERLPHIDQESIEEHLQWFFQHEAMEAEKRSLLARWRERIAHLADEARAADAADIEAQRHRADQRRRSRSAELRRQLAARSRLRTELAEGALDKLRQAEAEQARVDDERRARERRQRQATKRAIEEHRKKLAEEAAAAQLASPKTSRRSLSSAAPVSAEDRERISRRSSDLLQRKHEAVQAVQSPLRPKSASWNSPLPGRRKAYEHVQSRLLCTTEASAMRAAMCTTASWVFRSCEPLAEPEPAPGASPQRPARRRRLARPSSAPHLRLAERGRAAGNGNAAAAAIAAEAEDLQAKPPISSPASVMASGLRSSCVASGGSSGGCGAGGHASEEEDGEADAAPPPSLAAVAAAACAGSGAAAAASLGLRRGQQPGDMVACQRRVSPC